MKREVGFLIPYYSHTIPKRLLHIGSGTCQPYFVCLFG